MAALDGRYKAKVISVSLGGIGKNETPAIEVGFAPSAELIGSEWKEGKFSNCKKPFWLSDKVVNTGRSAGKTSVEITREQFKEIFGYEGGLAEAELATLVGKDVELACKPTQDGKYTEVDYVNPPGGRMGGGLKKLKGLGMDRLATLAGLWSGKPKEEKSIDAAELFKNMTQGAA